MFDWFFTQFGFSIVLMVLLVAVIPGAAGYSTFIERKVAAWIQDRIGPNRAGPRGLLQPLTDGVKFLFKEELQTFDRAVNVPDGARRDGQYLYEISGLAGLFEPERVREMMAEEIGEFEQIHEPPRKPAHQH